MKTQITKYVLAFLISFFGLFLWLSVDRAINVENASDWMVPIIYFGLFFITLSLGSIIIKQKVLLYSALAISFLSNLIFTFSFWHLSMIIFSFLLTSIGIERIAKEIKTGIKLDLYRSIRIGKSILIISLAFCISSQYYFETKNTSRLNTIPQFKADYLTSKIISTIYPDLKTMDTENITVDAFILKTSTDSSGDLMEKMLGSSMLNEEIENKEKIAKESQEQLLKEGRLKISDIAGREVSGSEKISTVFSEIINSKVNTYFSPSLGGENSSIISWIAVFVLFLTIISLGSFLSFIMLYLAMFIFWILRKTELVKVSKVMVEMEIIE